MNEDQILCMACLRKTPTQTCARCGFCNPDILRYTGQMLPLTMEQRKEYATPSN